MIRRFAFSLILSCGFVFLLIAQTEPTSMTWFIDRTDSVGGYSASALRRSPTIIETSYGKAALFSCFDSSALLVNCNPVGSDTAFTIEVYFRPDSTVLAGTNNEQRFIHIRNLSNDNRRILLETRLMQNQRWALDTYIKSESSNLTLVDSSKTYSTGEWHHVALTYGNRIMRQYVDGVELKSGQALYLPIDINGRTSIGARQDPRSWFNGAIRMVKITKGVLTPDKFTIPAKTAIKTGYNLPGKFHLNQNYPNPFNPSTIISYQLPNAGTQYIVSLRIYDLLGREVASLVDGYQNSGNYFVDFDVRNSKSEIASGVYIYKLTAGNFIESKKMALLR